MKKFSLIVPVYKQEKTIKANILSILDVLKTITVPFEIIPVIDGILDNSEGEIKKIKDSHVHVVGYKNNRGKGYAVRYGFAHAGGDVIGFLEFQDADVVLGSKRHPDSKVDYPTYRRILSWGYQQIVKVLFGLNVTDTQVGMKLYKRKLLEDVLPRLLVKHFAFDIEILAVAYHLGYRKIYESPVEINFFFSKTSMVWSKLFRVIYNMITDTLAVFYRLKIKRYYDNASKRKWRFDPELNFRINVG
ncbi:MAG: Glycosyl transferase, family 2 [Microgenomates group bacterium GW2011_GWB1_40_9]|nr:MAG: Glycosyl transferase, family 2 [Microgenomates group bacterium GW2011_GWB1_40_9]